MANRFVTSLTSENLLLTWSVQLPDERATKVERMRRGDDDTLYIVDSLNKCVKAFNITGDLQARFPPEVNQQTSEERLLFHDLRYPSGVAKVGDVTWMVDRDGSSLYGFESSGRLLHHEYGSPLQRPVDILSNPTAGSLYVINEMGTALQEYFPEQHLLIDLSDLKLVHYGGSELPPSNQRIILTDKSGFCGAFHLDEGKLSTKNLKTLSFLGDPNDHSPGGVCVDKHGFVYVTDVNNNQILVFDSSMEYVTSLSTSSWFQSILMAMLVPDAHVTGPLSGPIDVTVTSSGLLVVLEQAGRVKLFCHSRKMNVARMRERLLSGELRGVHRADDGLCSRLCSLL